MSGGRRKACEWGEREVSGVGKEREKMSTHPSVRSHTHHALSRTHETHTPNERNEGEERIVGRGVKGGKEGRRRAQCRASWPPPPNSLSPSPLPHSLTGTGADGGARGTRAGFRLVDMGGKGGRGVGDVAVW